MLKPLSVAVMSLVLFSSNGIARTLNCKISQNVKSFREVLGYKFDQKNEWVAKASGRLELKSIGDGKLNVDLGTKGDYARIVRLCENSVTSNLKGQCAVAMRASLCAVFGSTIEQTTDGMNPNPICFRELSSAETQREIGDEDEHAYGTGVKFFSVGNLDLGHQKISFSCDGLGQGFGYDVNGLINMN